MLITFLNHCQLPGLLTLVLYKRGVELTEFDIQRCDCSTMLLTTINAKCHIC